MYVIKNETNGNYFSHWYYTEARPVFFKKKTMARKYQTRKDALKQVDQNKRYFKKTGREVKQTVVGV